MDCLTIAAIRRTRNGSVTVCLDNGTDFTLDRAAAVEAGLHEGQKISYGAIEQLRDSGLVLRALNCALRYLEPRPRSEREIRARLNRQRYDADTIENTLTRLKSQGLVDDAAFAHFWRENRTSFRPMSQGLLTLELKQKGIDADTIAEAIADMDDEQSAYHAARKKARSLGGLEYSTFAKRLGSFLRRRGFGYEVTARTIDRAWEEQGNPQADEPVTQKGIRHE
jgi:regulatory protein